MKDLDQIPQLFLRLALGIGFILPVMDRLGFLGAAGINGNAWGNWQNFVDYTHSLVPYVNSTISSAMAVLATFAEIVFGMALVVGFKTRLAAIGSFLLTIIFAVSMFFFAGYRAPFNYSVFVCSAAALLLTTIPSYKWSIDNLKTVN